MDVQRHTAPSAPSLRFDPGAIAFREDPYPVYRHYRELGPVVYRPEHDDWIVTGYDTVRQWLRGHRPGKQERPLITGATLGRPGFHQELDGETIALALRGANAVHFNHSVQKTSPPYHTQLREVLGGYFSKEYFRRLEPVVLRTADRLLSKVAEKDSWDVVDDFAFPFTASVACHVVGLPFADRFKLRDWSYSYLRSMSLPLRKNRQVRRDLALMGMASYLTDHIQRRARQPQDDFISYLTKCHLDSAVSYDALVGNVMTIILGGFENTQNGIALAVYHLLRHPAQLALLRQDASLAGAAVEECLRFDSPVQCYFTHSYSGTLAGHEVRPGQRIHICLGAANRDPDAYAQPDVFGITATRRSHLAFGTGIHYCLGAILGRMEMKVALQRILARFPRLRLSEDGRTLRDFYNVRCVQRLPVDA